MNAIEKYKKLIKSDIKAHKITNIKMKTEKK